MAPIVSVVGLPNTGKTTLLEKLVVELKKRSYRIAIIKHGEHGFEIDKPGKDSYRLEQAGTDIMVLSAPDRIAYIEKADHDASLQELSCLVGDSVDLIITEGFKHREAPKIEVHRKELGKKLLFKPDQLLALVTDEPLDLPVWQCSPGEIAKLADLLESTFITNRKEEGATLCINGETIPMTPFVQDFFTKTLLGAVSALKGVKNIKTLTVSLKRKTK